MEKNTQIDTRAEIEASSQVMASIPEGGPIVRYRKMIMKRHPDAILHIIIEPNEKVTVKIEGLASHRVVFGVIPDKEVGSIDRKILYALKSLVSEYCTRYYSKE